MPNLGSLYNRAMRHGIEGTVPQLLHFLFFFGLVT